MFKDEGSTVMANEDTSLTLDRTVYSIKAFIAIPVSCVEAQPLSVKRWAFNHLTIGSTKISCLET